jgi:membrane-associated phospholipid phosphatase
MKLKHRLATMAMAAALTSSVTCENLSAATTIQTIGDVLYIALPTAAAGMTLYHKDREGAVQFGKSLLTTVGVTLALKYTIDANRPRDNGKHSFPSGHTSTSFSAAEFIRKRYGWKYGVPAYTVATFVGYSRLEAHQHHTHDVLAGAAIGILSSYIFTTPYHGWNVDLEGDSKGASIKLTRHF